MDTGVSNRRPRFVLGRGVIAKGRVAALPIIEHLDIFEDVLCRVFTGRVVPMVHELARECAEKTFNTGIVPAVTFTAHARGDAVLAERRWYLVAAYGGVYEIRGGSGYPLWPKDSSDCFNSLPTFLDVSLSSISLTTLDTSCSIFVDVFFNVVLA